MAHTDDIGIFFGLGSGLVDLSKKKSKSLKAIGEGCLIFTLCPVGWEGWEKLLVPQFRKFVFERTLITDMPTSKTFQETVVIIDSMPRDFLIDFFSGLDTPLERGAPDVQIPASNNLTEGIRHFLRLFQTCWS
jgi:hypothetical protein